MREAVGEKENKSRCGEEWEREKMWRRVKTREEKSENENEKRCGEE
jgi:hypothetical protein